MNGVKQYVSDATCTTSITSSLLDLVISGADSVVFPRLCTTEARLVRPWRGHVACSHRYEAPSYKLQFPPMKNVNWQQFQSDVYSSIPFTARENAAIQFDIVVTKILDKHCPVQNVAQNSQNSLLLAIIVKKLK